MLLFQKPCKFEESKSYCLCYQINCHKVSTIQQCVHFRHLIYNLVDSDHFPERADNLVGESEQIPDVVDNVVAVSKSM